MAVTGMGTDTPPSGSPTHFPALAATSAFEADEEEKSDYGADDEGEDEEEVDNSFDYVPSIDGSGSSEDFGTYNTRTNQVPPPGIPARSEADVVLEPLSPTKDAATSFAMRDTTVVKEYLDSVGEGDLSETSDKVQQENKLMAVAVSSSSAVIDRATWSKLEVWATEGLRGSIKTHSAFAEVNNQNEKDVVDENMEKSNVGSFRLLDVSEVGTSHSDENEQDMSVEISSTKVQEQPADVEYVVVDEDVAGNEAPPSGDVVQQTNEEDSTSLTQRDDQPEKNQTESPADPQEQPAETKRAASPPPFSVPKSPERTNMPTQAKKRKQNSTPPSDYEEAKAQDNNASPNTSPPRKTPVAPSHTPKQSKRAASKKRKKLPTIESGESGDEESLPIRRSSRIKHMPPKYTYPAKQLADETVMSHFDRSPGNSVITCKYCDKEMPISRGIAQRHLKACPAFTTQEQSALGDDTEDKTALPSSLAAKANEKDVKMEDTTHESGDVSDHAASLVHLMGSEDLAGKVKGAFQSAAFAGHAPISRFQDLITDDVTGLRHLRVQDLLDAVDPLDGQTVLLHVKSAGGRRSTGQESLNPVSKAKARDMENCSLRFPAPRSVAKIFIAPLATELGLDYAMHQHTAKLVSCPEQGTVVDWRFHRSETVVFQLGGKALWKMRMGPVHNPLSCYHPDSWLLDNAAEVDKVHRVCTMKKHVLGSLTPPFDELHVFDENASSTEVDEELHEHMLKPGSVAYLPAGTWFETETKEKNVVWLEVQLEAMTYENLLLAAIKQLAWRETSMRMNVQLYPGNRGEAKRVRRHMGACMESLRDEIAGLDTSDLVPEYLVTDDLKDLRSQGLVRETSKSSASTSFEVDLTNPKFKLNHVKVFKDVAYRVNPVAILRSVDEISHLEKDEDEAPASVTTPHRVLKKSPKPKPKRKQGLRVITHAGKHTYVLDEVFGNDDFRSQLHVKFQCSAEQSRLVEWLRSRGVESFGVEEFSRDDDSVLHRSKSSARCVETGRNLLRFLYFVGYVSHVKSLKQTPVQRQIVLEAA